jgi:hypothetical protein
MILSKFSQLGEWEKVVFIAFSAIIIILFAGFLGVHLAENSFGYGGSLLPSPKEFGSGIQTWLVRWDASYFQKIALNGYQADGIERAFFPLYPLLCGILAKYTMLPVLWIGFAISGLCFIGACLVLYKLVKFEYNNDEALYSVFVMSIFPMSFYFVAFYPESMFLLLSITSVYFALRGRFILSGIAIALAGGTSPLAPILAIPYIVEFISQRKFSNSRWMHFIIGALVAPMGMLSYLAFIGNYTNVMNGLNTYATLQASEWYRSFSWPWMTLFNGLEEVLSGRNMHIGWFYQVSSIQNTTFVLASVAISIYGWFYIRKSIAIYFISGLIFSLATSGPDGNVLMSFPRHMAILFPVYIILSRVLIRLNYTKRLIFIGTSILFLIFYTAWFSSGRWVA